MRRVDLACVSLTALAVAMAANGPACAQSRSGPDTRNIEEVVVTAQRREERLMDVPMSVSAITASELKNSGVQGTRDLNQVVPGLSTPSNGKAFQPAIRGISSSGTAAGDEQNVALYVDGAYLAAPSGNALALKNIERIEVLRGPQGTLFGRNATGGAIRIITRDPGPERELQASFDYGTKLNSKDYSLYAATPISDTLAIGVSANIYDDAGYVENLLPGWSQGKFAETHSWNARAKLLWEPTDSLRVMLAYDRGRSQSDAAFALRPLGDLNANRNNPVVIMPTEPWQIAYNFKPTQNGRSSGTLLEVGYRGDKIDLASTTSYRTHDVHAIFDNDRTNANTTVTVTEDSAIWVTQEFIANSHFKGPLNFVAGAYYYHLDSDNDLPTYSGPTVSAAGQLLALGARTTETKGYVKTESIAGFGEATYEITPDLKVVAGARYTTETKTLLTVPLAPVRPRLTDRDTWRNWTYRLTSQYDFSPEANVYATFSTGFKSGVYLPTSATFVQKVEPERVAGIEVGAKARIAPGVNFTAAIFQYNYKNIQVQQNNFINGAATIVLTNAAVAKIRGAEAELTARVTQGLQLRAGLSWLPKAEYTDYPGALDSVPMGYPGSLNPSLCPGPRCGLGNDQIVRDLSGTRMIRAPEMTANLSATYTHDIGPGRADFTATFYHTSKFFWAPGEHASQPGYSLVNLSAGWQPENGRYRLGVWARNVGNTDYFVYLSPNATGMNVAYAPPREIGFTLSYSY